MAMNERGVDPVAVDSLDISVIAALLGIDRMEQEFQRETAAIMRARVAAAAEGRPAPQWDVGQ